MVAQKIIFWLITYKYSILFPIAIVEGNIESLIVGFLSRLGYLNPFISAVIIALGNLTGDAILYWIGFYKGERFALKWGKYIGLNQESLEVGKKIFHARKGTILFFSKITNGFGFAMAVLFAAGVSKIPFKRYMGWNALGESVWTGILVALGFILGHLFAVVDNIIFRVSLVTFSFIFVFIAFRVWKYFIGKKKL